MRRTDIIKASLTRKIIPFWKSFARSTHVTTGTTSTGNIGYPCYQNFLANLGYHNFLAILEMVWGGLSNIHRPHTISPACIQVARNNGTLQWWEVPGITMMQIGPMKVSCLPIPREWTPAFGTMGNQISCWKYATDRKQNLYFFLKFLRRCG